MNADRIKCWECGIPVPDVPEDAVLEEHLCNGCWEKLETQEVI